MTNGRYAIEVSNLTKEFGPDLAVDTASFTVPFGAVTGFIGANGSGKSTTMRMILGLTLPTSGTALVGGLPYSDQPMPRQVVGSVLNRIGAHPGVSAVRHLQLVATSAGLPSERISEVLDEVGLSDAAHRKLGTYSTGMSQRLALASALLADPQVLLLDEPASGLDPGGVRWLRELLRAKADAGAAIFVSTHQLAELSSIVDHVVLIDRGRILANEPTSSLLERTETSRLEDAFLSLGESSTTMVNS